MILLKINKTGKSLLDWPREKSEELSAPKTGIKRSLLQANRNKKVTREYYDQSFSIYIPNLDEMDKLFFIKFF